MVEDENEIRELISLLLLRQGHRVQQCSSAMEALNLMEKHKFDLVILDWMLPNMSGIDLLKTLNSKPKGTPADRPPVLMVTAKSEPMDIVLGLEAGADDYVTKPFEPAVLSARVKALLRRAKALQKDEISEVIRIGEISLDTATYEVKCKGEVIHLTPSEFKILLEMGKNSGKVLTRDHLISVVQGEGINVTGRTIDTHVFGLRKKLGDQGELIDTIRGVGYRVKVE